MSENRHFDGILNVRLNMYAEVRKSGMSVCLLESRLFVRHQSC